MIRPNKISLPDRLPAAFFNVTSSSSSPSTPSPHTPPTFNPLFQSSHPLLPEPTRHQTSSSHAAKRHREDEIATSFWTDQETELVQSILAHPLQPLSAVFPPGDLPPPLIIDELANQIITFAPSTSLGWQHSWEETRGKIFEVALKESKASHGQDRKSRKTRPSMRRVDSMDFLDERPEEKDDTGRTLRLSTSLQKSARNGSRSASPVNLLITPASPGPPRPRLNRARESRPSLLQRGRSFTAEDLAHESEENSVNQRVVRLRSASLACLVPSTATLALPEILSQSEILSHDGDEDRSLARRSKRLRPLERLGDPTAEGLRSPFEEKSDFSF